MKCFCTYDAFHIRIRKDVSEQVCDSCWIRQGGMNPSGNACLSKSTSELTLLKLVIRQSKVKLPAIFHCLTRRSSECWTAARCTRNSPLSLERHYIAWSRANTSFFHHCSRVWLTFATWRFQVSGHALGVVLFFLMVSGEVQLCM